MKSIQLYYRGEPIDKSDIKIDWLGEDGRSHFGDIDDFELHTRMEEMDIYEQPMGGIF